MANGIEDRHVEHAVCEGVHRTRLPPTCSVSLRLFRMVWGATFGWPTERTGARSLNCQVLHAPPRRLRLQLLPSPRSSTSGTQSGRVDHGLFGFLTPQNRPSQVCGVSRVSHTSLRALIALAGIYWRRSLVPHLNPNAMGRRLPPAHGQPRLWGRLRCRWHRHRVCVVPAQLHDLSCLRRAPSQTHDGDLSYVSAMPWIRLRQAKSGGIPTIVLQGQAPVAVNCRPRFDPRLPRPTADGVAVGRASFSADALFPAFSLQLRRALRPSYTPIGRVWQAAGLEAVAGTDGSVGLHGFGRKGHHRTCGHSSAASALGSSCAGERMVPLALRQAIVVRT